VVISDDILRDDHDIPVDTYWEDDGLDIFIDEDHINENHECGSFAFNAFAYHIAAYPRTPLGAKTIFSDTLATYNVVDLGLSCSPTHSLVFNDHALVKVFRSGTVYTWEIALDVYDNSYADDGINHPVVLQPGKFLGLAVAYADNDNGTREGYYGSEENYNDNSTDKPMNKYTDHFGKVELVEEFHTDLKNYSSRSRSSFVYPVPARDFVYFDRSLDKDGHIRIFDYTGRVVMSTFLHDLNHSELNIQSLRKGVYSIELIYDSCSYNDRIIVE
jgi:hypothetical protein